MENRLIQHVKQDSFAALRFKDFRAYIAMNFFFTFAYQMQTVVVGFYIYQLTKSVLALGMLGLCEAVPAIGIALYGGYIADKSEKRKMLLWIYTGVFLSTTVMYLLTLKSLGTYLHAGWIVTGIDAMIFCNGVARAFYGPATFSVYADSIPKKLYPNGSTWSTSAKRLAYILGPATGGLLYGFAGITTTFYVILFSILIALILVYFLKEYPAVFKPGENIWLSLGEGIRFVISNKIMLGAMSLDLFSVFFGGVIALLPAFAHTILKVGPEGLGTMRAVFSVGSISTMLVMSRYSPMNRPWRNLLIAVTGFGLSIICFGLSQNFHLTLFLLFVQGAFDSVSVIIRGSIMQLLTPDQMRGRVSAVSSMFIGSSNELGDFESGTAASILGLVPAVIFGGCITLTVVTIAYFKTKNMLPLSLKDLNTANT
nr:MFS transporter [Pedobacter sp. L105]